MPAIQHPFPISDSVSILHVELKLGYSEGLHTADSPNGVQEECTRARHLVEADLHMGDLPVRILEAGGLYPGGGPWPIPCWRRTAIWRRRAAADEALCSLRKLLVGPFVVLSCAGITRHSVKLTGPSMGQNCTSHHVQERVSELAM